MDTLSPVWYNAGNKGRGDRRSMDRVMHNREERLAIARSMNLFSAAFVRVVFSDPEATQYVLRILMGKPDLVVETDIPEYRVSKLGSHDSILDVYARDGSGTVYHIEVQLADNDNHILRVRTYSAMIDSDLLDKGKKYDELPDAYVFYISLHDFMNLGEPIALVRSYIGKKNVPYNDGKYIYYVNASVDDGSDVADLMDYFKSADPNDASHGALSKRIHFLKCEPGGEEAMCEITKSFVEEGKVIGVVEYLRRHGSSDDEIKKEIKEEFDLTDYEAESFIQGTKEVAV